MIYRADGHSKIGRSANPSRRLSWWRSALHQNLQKYYPMLVVKVPDSVQAEAAFHATFDKQRARSWGEGYVRPGGEWFRLTERDLSTFVMVAQELGEEIYRLDGEWTLPEQPSWRSR